MSDFGEGKFVIGRKDHMCIGCMGKIAKGERHYHYTGVWEGDWQNWRLHTRCEEISRTMDLSDGFVGGFLNDELTEQQKAAGSRA
jgi:hypothetical protein